MAGLLLVLGGVLQRLPAGWTVPVSLPLVGLLVTGLRPPPRWGGWAAVLMIPYVCIAVMELIAVPEQRGASLIVAGGAVLAFFAGLDAARRSGVSLR